MSNVIRHERFVKSYVGKNNNKFWYITEYNNATVKVEYGRVGYNAQEKIHIFKEQQQATKKYDTMVRSKLRGKKDEPPYRKLDVIENAGDVITSNNKIDGKRLQDMALKQLAGKNIIVKKLVQHLVSANIHNITSQTTLTYDESTGLFSTPCGIVTETSVNTARQLLSDMFNFVKDELFDDSDYVNMLEDYLMLIPKNVGRKLDPHTVFIDTKDLQQQSDILDSLQASIDTLSSDNKKSKKNKPEEKVFNVTLVPLTDKKEHERIRTYYQNNRRSGHVCAHLDVKQVFKLKIEDMDAAFEGDGKGLGNVKELWHGTRVGNILSILSKGLIIPSANASYVTGRMFGNGIYFSDQSTKALNYSYGYWDGGKKDIHCFMFLANVAMGKAYTPSRTRYHQYPMKGYDSTFAEANISGVRNNEMIVYRTSQCNLVYLVEFTDWKQARDYRHNL